MIKSLYNAESQPIFNSLKILSLPNIHEFNCLIFMYKCIKENKFPSHKTTIMNNMPKHNYVTRYRALLCPPFKRLERCKKSFLITGINLWNGLDNVSKDLKTIYSFKKVFKSNKFDEKIEHDTIEVMKC